MNHRKWLVVLLVVVLFSSLTATNISWWQAKSEWLAEKTDLTSQLSDSRLALETAQTDLHQTQLRLDEKETELQELNSEFGDTKTQLDNAVDHVFLLVDELKSVRADLTSQKTYYEGEVENARKTGYEKGKKEILTSRDILVLKKPTRQELIKSNLLLVNGRNSDGARVMLQRWIPRELVCVDFAEGLNDAGIRERFQVGVVFLVYRYTDDGGKYGHFLNVFKTTEGNIYVEPQTLQEVTIRKGESYTRQNGFEPEPGDTIREVIIFW